VKWYRFKDKLPEIGTNVLINHESEKMISILEFTLEARKAILDENGHDCFSQIYYSDDASEDREYDVRDSDFWSYPSSARIPKN
jgi:hypothetical protein